MTIYVYGKFINDVGSDWECVPFDDEYDAYLFIHQTLSNGDAKWMSIDGYVDGGIQFVDFQLPHTIAQLYPLWDCPQSLVSHHPLFQWSVSPR